jgi:hypothetical protein
MLGPSLLDAVVEQWKRIRAKRALRSLSLSQGKLREARLAQIPFGKLKAGSRGAKNACSG